MPQSKHYVLFMRSCCLLVGCMATGMAYSMDAFNLYADALKTLFKYSQSEVEFIVSLANVGLLSSLPAGLLLRVCGCRLLSVFSFLITTGSYTLLWVATYAVDYYSERSSLIAVFFFLSGIGGGIMYISATTVNVRNFSTRYLGIVSGLLHSVKSAVLGLLMGVYGAVFAAPKLLPTLPESDLLDNTPASAGAAGNWSEELAQFGNWTVTAISSNDSAVDGPLADVPVPRDNIRGYFAFVAILYAVTNLLGIFFYGNYPPAAESTTKDVHGEAQAAEEKRPLLSDREDGEGREVIRSEGEDMNGNAKAGNTPEPPPPTTDNSATAAKWSFWKLLRSYYYHAVLWPSVFLIAYRTCYINNLLIITKAMRQEAVTPILLSLIPILGTLLKPVLGLIFDFSSRALPRSAMLLLFLLVDALTAALCAALLSDAAVVGVGLVAAIFGSCTVQTQSPAIVVETFGKASFAYAWGFVTLAWSLATLALQMLFGRLYDTQLTPEGGRDCYGRHCFVWFYLISAAMALLAALLIVFAVVRQYRAMRSRGQQQHKDNKEAVVNDGSWDSESATKETRLD